MTQTIALKDLTDRANLNNREFNNEKENSFVAQLFVFEGEDYLGWDCFNNSRITVGKSKSADLVLNEKSISDIHAVFYIKNEQVIVSYKGQAGGIRVNGKAVETCILSPLDVVGIGAYSLKIRLKKIIDKNEAAEQHDIPPGFLETTPPHIYNSGEKEARYNECFVNDSIKETTTDDHEDVADENISVKVPNHDHSLQQIEDEDIVLDDPIAFETWDHVDEQPDLIKDREASDPAIEPQEDHEKEPSVKETFLKDESLEAESISSETVPQNDLLPKKGWARRIFRFRTKKGETPGNKDVDNESKSRAVAHTIQDSDRSDELTCSEGTAQTYSSRDEDNEISVVSYEEDDENDEKEEETLPFLKDDLIDNKIVKSPAGSGKIADDCAVLEVVKFRENNIVDVRFLNHKEKYYIQDEKGKFCLAENKNSENSYFYFNDRIKGLVRYDYATSIDTLKLCTDDNLYHKKRATYRDRLPKTGEVIISDGNYEYLLRRAIKSQSPSIPDAPKTKSHLSKNLAKSAGVHFVCLLVLGFFISLPDPPTPVPPESRFVQIDTGQLNQKKQPPKAKVQPVRKQVQTAQKETIKPSKRKAKKRSKNISVSSKRKKSSRKSKAKSRSAIASRSPNAGGGAGKAGGNIANRNVNQAGLLGALGIKNGIGLMPKQAIAAVTNLDAVSSTRGSEGNFKVGGIVGKLGGSKIAVSSGPVVTTKGSAQVLRSAGVKGKGSVAALAKGKTGQNQVMALVSADLNRKVQIQGGMSREAVKKVIDKHLDEVSFCYESALVANPSLLGKVIFEWKILTSGRVGMIRIKTSTINSNELHSCIKRAIKGWQFPKPKGSEVVVSYPFVFDIVGF